MKPANAKLITHILCITVSLPSTGYAGISTQSAVSFVDISKRPDLRDNQSPRASGNVCHGDKIGQGSFGSIYATVDCAHTHLLDGRVVKYMSFNSDVELQLSFKEYDIMVHLNGTGLSPMVFSRSPIGATFVDNAPKAPYYYYIVMERVGRPLSLYIGAGKIPLAIKIVELLSKLHLERRVIHGDISPNNLAFKDPKKLGGDIVFLDFGESHYIRRRRSRSEYQTIEYRTKMSKLRHPFNMTPSEMMCPLQPSTVFDDLFRVVEIIIRMVTGRRAVRSKGEKENTFKYRDDIYKVKYNLPEHVKGWLPASLKPFVYLAWGMMEKHMHIGKSRNNPAFCWTNPEIRKERTINYKILIDALLNPKKYTLPTSWPLNKKPTEPLPTEAQLLAVFEVNPTNSPHVNNGQIGQGPLSQPKLPLTT